MDSLSTSFLALRDKHLLEIVSIRNWI